tara:strand:+ start:394 stop:876 length:483 start_codon:yes stop_codon:yes gene_type:complete
MKSNKNIIERIQSIQAISTINNLKFRYWNACDSKNPADILSCFCVDDVYINFEDFGIFSSARAMVKKYELNSCHDHLIEQHAGKNQIIKLLSTNKASGFWSLSYSLIDTLKNINLYITGTYEDIYVRDESNNWLIKETVFKKRTSMYRSLSSGQCSNPRI